MQALALVSPGRVEIVERPMPEPAASEVLVRMTGVGICGSDLSVFDGHREVPGAPWVMGHEGTGVIVAVGSEVTGRRIGQRVVIEPNYCCFTCANCRAGFTSGCENRVIVGINFPGLLAEYVAVPGPFAWPVPDDFAATVAAPPRGLARVIRGRFSLAQGEEAFRCARVVAGKSWISLGEEGAQS